MSAKQRRVNGPPSQMQPPTLPLPPSQTQQQVPSSQPVNMTLPQVLQMMEARLRKLEQVEPVKKETESDESVAQIAEIVASMKDFQSEYDSRFNILATEINQLKDIVIKLQTYTMDVNKTLLEERVRVVGGEAPIL